MRPWIVLLAVAVLAGGEPGGITRVLAGVPAGARISVAVADCKDGSWLVRRGADDPVSMASVNKLLVAIAAWRELGPEWRFRTRLVASSTAADIPWLGIIGGGDPTFDEHFREGDPDRVFTTWAAELKRRGVHKIGDVIVDGRYFAGAIRPSTWPTGGNNPISWFSAPSSAFACNDNCISVRAVPASPGQPCTIELRPDSPRISVINRTSSVASGGDRTFIVTRAANADQVTVSGAYGVATSWFDLAIHADPDLMAADHLRRRLEQSGIAVSGSVRRGEVDPAKSTLLIDERSPLLPALTVMNQRSQNFYAEQLLRVLGAEQRQDGSLTGGCAAIRASLTRLLNGEPTGLEQLDGSGLSYGNKAPAALIVRLLVAMDRDPLAATFRSTLKDRPSAGVVAQVKTGTLAVATCLAGYITAAAPDTTRRIAFAILLNKGAAQDMAWAPGLRDRLFEAIAALVR
jgi:D-alanyl-D-alanine carboxypeptidase/D-alanyl-D-alanine-endopeptidase (penicillin-binding protein 4)